MHFGSPLSKVACPLRGIVLDLPDASIVGGNFVPAPFSPRPTPLYPLPVLAFRGQPKACQRRQVGPDPLRFTHPRSGPHKSLCDALERAQPRASGRRLEPVDARWVHAGAPGDGSLTEARGISSRT